jgi:hypothetical protein
MLTVPFKLNQDRRHHIPRQRHKVTNWADYEASLRQRGGLTVWFTEEAIAAWAAAARTTRGGQPWYSPLAILTALTLRAAPCVSVVAAWIESVIPGALEDAHGSLRTTVQRRGGGPLAATRELVA